MSLPLVHPVPIAQLLILLMLANATPLAAARLLGRIWAAPLDGGRVLSDGRPALGSSKTVRGVVLGILAPTLAAPALGLAWWLGLIAGIAAMTGDLLSSFVKRRLGRAPSSRATGLDQVPESLLPAVACGVLMDITVADIALVVAIFFAGEILASRLLFRFGLRDTPY